MLLPLEISVTLLISLFFTLLTISNIQLNQRTEATPLVMHEDVKLNLRKDILLFMTVPQIMNEALTLCI